VATAASYERIDLTWQDNSTNESGWEVHHSTTGPTGTFSLFTQYPWPNVTAATFTGLQTATQHCYKVRSFKGSGRGGNVSAFSNVACATTLGLPLPAAPSAASAAPAPFGRIRITWADNATDESGFRVERSATSTGPWTTAGMAVANATSLEDSEPPGPEQPACYRLFAFNTHGDSDPSNVDCTARPAAPTNLGATVLDDGAVDLTWTDNSDVEDSYEVVRGTSGAVGMSVVATLPASATAYRDVGLPDSSYGYAVRPTKDGGPSWSSNFVQAIVATAPPNAPANVEAVPTGSSVVDVMWVDVAMNEEGSRVERSTDGGVSWVTAATIGWYLVSPWAQDGAALSEQQVCYRVIAFNRVGESPPSNTDCTTPPAAPAGLTATGVDAVTVDFAWTDNSAVEDGYQIGIDYGYDYWEIIAIVGPNTTSYRLVSDYAYGYTYFVVASKDGGYSDWSTVAYPTSPLASSSLSTVSPSRVPALRAAPRRSTGKRSHP
jgi:hypothetical protein